MGKSKKQLIDTHEQELQTLIVVVYAPGLHQEPSHYFEEFSRLVETTGRIPAHTLSMKLRSIDHAYYFTKGKLEDLATFCTTHNIEEVIISDLLSPLQERNLQDLLHCRVMSRSELILEIFYQSAHSAEGKIQVEMAYLEHLKARLAGRGKELAQQEGFVGARGPGETMKEQLKRYYVEKMRQARRRLEQVAKSREVQRKKRLKKNIPLACLVGYTNAGKSSLLNILTKSHILVEDKLFATLDTTTRELFLSDTNKVLLADTVGFINQLPHQLIEAFKSTLDELRYANMLLHVIDAHNPAWPEHIQTVEKTLEELDVTAPRINIFNKIDLLTPEEQAELLVQAQAFAPFVLTHTKDKNGTSDLITSLQTSSLADTQS